MITKQITHAGSFAEDGEITFYEVIRIMEPGEETDITTGLPKTIGVGDDVSGEPQMVREIVAELHTPTRIKDKGYLPYDVLKVGFVKGVSYDGEWLEDGQIQVRRIRRKFEDGVEISKKYHRHVVDLEDDITNEALIVRDLAKALRTPKRIAARRAFKQQQQEIDNV